MNPYLLVPALISHYLESISSITDLSEKSSKLNAFLHQLEDEIQKMVALEHLFPICNNLLKDGFGESKEEIMGRRNPELILVEANSNGVQRGYMPNDTIWNSGLNPSDVHHRRNLQIESGRIVVGCGGNNNIPIQNLGRNLTIGIGNNQSPFLDCSGQIVHVPMMEGRNGGGSLVMDPMIRLSLGQAGGEGNHENGRIVVDDDESDNSVMVPMKKQRRYWSKEMCQSFRNAVLSLGGPRRATPKNILKLMKVEGLTSDEVKSHLQKHRKQMESIAASTSKKPGGSS